MKFYSFLLLLVSILLVSCVSPITKQLNINDRIDKIEAKIDDKTDQKESLGVDYLYGADFALTQVKTNTVETDTAKKMTSRAILAFGLPSTKEASNMESIVNGLISTNKALQQSSEKKLREKDLELQRLESKIESLQASLDKANKKSDEISLKNAGLANTWWKIVTFVKISIYVLVGFLVLRIAVIFVPPPYNSIGYILDYVIGGVYKLLSKAFTKANDAAGVVSSNVKSTLTNVVSAVEKAKNSLNLEDVESDSLEGYSDNHKFSLSEVKKLLEKQSEKAVDILKTNLSISTTADDKNTITEIKSDNNI